MNDSSPTDTLARAQRIDRACDAFESAWMSGLWPSLEQALASAMEGERDDLLCELLPIELFHRRKRGEQPRSEQYTTRFPSLDATYLEQLIVQSFAAATDQSTTGSRLANAKDETLRLSESTVPPAIARNGGGVELPGYEFLGELGRGGMGVVYKARQVKLGRTVAVKMVLADGHARTEERQRFKSEAAAIVRLQHPNIVQIYDFGTHAGRPFFTLEYLDGGTMAQKFAGVPQPPRESARLVETLARAIHQAHQAGIVHRDLKPANVLMTKDGVPKITDFGLAKQQGADHAATDSGMLLGTPQYMAPEQASGQGRGAGPSVDIYALGAILYELLAGRPPFQAANLTELLQAICHVEPTAPRLIKQSTPRDLETICLKCLQKLPAGRYASAAELADDLQRYLSDQPIHARPISTVEKGWRWCRRNPWIAGPSAALLTVLLGVSIGSTIVANRFNAISKTAVKNADDAEKARDLADQRALETRLELARSNVNEARMLRRSQRVGQYSEAIAKVKFAHDVFRDLERQGLRVSDEDWAELRDEATSTLLVPDLLTVGRWRRSSPELPQVATDVVHQRYVRMTANALRAEICRFGSDEPIDSIAAPDGSSFEQGMFSAEGNHLLLYSRPDNQMHFWDVSSTPKHIRSTSRPGRIGSISNDGSVFLGESKNPGAQFTRVADGTLIAETNPGMPIFGFPLHPHLPWAALSSGNRAIVFDYARQRMVWQRSLPHTFNNAAWSQDGRWLVLARSDGGVLQAFAANTGEPIGLEVKGFDADGVFPIPASRSGLIASTDWSGSLRLFSLRTGRLHLTSSGKFFNWPRALGPEGCFTLVYEGKDYVLPQPRGGRMTEFAPYGTGYLALSHSGRLLVAYREPGGAGIYDLPSCELLATIPSEWGELPLGFESEDGALLMYGKGSLVRVPLSWADNARSQLQLGSAQPLLNNNMRDVWGMNRQGTVIAAPGYGQGGIVYRRPPQTIYTPAQNDVRHAQVSPDGQWLVLGSHVQGRVAVYSTEDGRLVQELVSEGGFSHFSPDGRWLAVAKFAGGGELFQVDGWKSRGNLPGQFVAFTHDGQLLAVDSGVSTIAFYETESLRKIGQLEIQDQVRVQPSCFTPDGTGLVACTTEGRRLLYFDLAGLRSDLQDLELDWEMAPIPRPTNREEQIPGIEVLPTTPDDANPATAASRLLEKSQRILLENHVDLARIFGWQSVKSVIPKLDSTDKKRYPGIAALVTDLQSFERAYDRQSPPHTWPAEDADKLLLRNPHFWHSMFEAAPGDSSLTVVQIGMLCTLGDLDQAFNLLQLTRHDDSIPPENRRKLTNMQFQIAKNVKPHAGRTIQSGNQHYDERRYDEAVADYQLVLEVWPKCSAAHYELEQALQRKDQTGNGGFARSRHANPLLKEAYQGTFTPVEFEQQRKVFPLVGRWEAKVIKANSASSELLLGFAKEFQEVAILEGRLHELALFTRQMVIARNGKYDQEDEEFMVGSLRELIPASEVDAITLLLRMPIETRLTVFPRAKAEPPPTATPKEP